MPKRIPCAGVLLIDKNKALLIKYTASAEHLTGTYGLPSGKLKENESYTDCALRKLVKETGLVTSKKDLVELPKTYVATIERKTEGVNTYSMKVFKCKSFHGRLKGTSKEIPLWIDLSEISKLNLLPNVWKIVNDGLNL